MTLSEYIINYRKNHNLSLRQFAKMTGLSHSYIRMLEIGVNPSTQKRIVPTVIAMNNIAETTGITLDELFRILDDMPVSLSPTTEEMQYTEEDEDDPSLTPDESQLLSIYRSLNAQSKDMLLSTAIAFSGNPDMQKEAIAQRAM